MSSAERNSQGKLVLIRHGASEWNLQNIFTGWENPPLSEKGKQEALQAAENLKNYHFDEAFTSELSRAQNTLKIILKGIGQQEIPVINNACLNERNYGDLQGKNKDEMRKEYGEEQVHIWRRSYDVAPPNGESLKETAERVIPYFKEHIIPDVVSGKSIIVAAHGNSLRSIIMYLEKLSPDTIVSVNVPTGVPHVYTLDEAGHMKEKTILQ